MAERRGGSGEPARRWRIASRALPAFVLLAAVLASAGARASSLEVQLLCPVPDEPGEPYLTQIVLQADDEFIGVSFDVLGTNAIALSGENVLIPDFVPIFGDPFPSGSDVLNFSQGLLSLPVQPPGVHPVGLASFEDAGGTGPLTIAPDLGPGDGIYLPSGITDLDLIALEIGPDPTCVPEPASVAGLLAGGLLLRRLAPRRRRG